MIDEQMLEYYNKSSDIRCLLVTDPLLHACFNKGLTPMETIICLADRAAKMLEKADKTFSDTDHKLLRSRNDSNT